MSRAFQVVEAQTPVHEQPIRFGAGAALRAEYSDPDDPSWVWTHAQDGRSGWVPRAALSGNQGEVAGLREYDAQELSAQPGERGEASEGVGGWWWCRMPDGRSGWLRARCLEWA